MKKWITILLFLTIIYNVYSQQNNANFLFPDYQKAIINFNWGAQSTEKINYNLVEEKLYFIDKSDSLIKIVSGIQSIASIQIQDKFYIIDTYGLKERVTTEPPFLYVQYKAATTSQPTTVAYGGSSNIASVSTYTDYRSGGQQTILKNSGLQVSNISPVYWLEKNSRFYQFDNKKQFLKIYPAFKDKLKVYLSENKVDFGSVCDVKKLVEFAEALK